MRIALAHDWLCGFRGGEAVLERLARLVAGEHEPAGLYVMFDDGRPVAPAIDALRTTVARLGRLPAASTRLRRWLFPLYPLAVTDLSRRLARAHRERPIDLVISTSSAAIKGLRPPPGVPHLCYCHNPARYAWSQAAPYRRGRLGWLRGAGLALFAGSFRRWDRRTSANVTRFLANSTHTASLVNSCYGRDARVVFPPVRTGYFTPGEAAGREDFWLVVSALEPYKRVDLAIAAARLAGRRLVVVGGGSQAGALRRLGGPGIEFRRRVSDEELRSLYRRAELLLFPQVEDFGIVAAEALACGLPVVARAEGGALDIVSDGLTGALFSEPQAGALVAAAARAPRECAAACRASAERFCEARFDAELRGAIAELGG
ncbi:MAG TPA: glycosyltransferase [Phycisphaerales bacterium]|nr:glycosyltransferase [Phycisphaerales bacterium]